MTNERAIELLRRISDSQFDGIHGDERREALEMAVRALSGDGDTISRKMAIEAYGDWYVEEGTTEGFIGTVKQLPEALPPAHPTQTNADSTQTNALDCVSRKQAIDGIKKEILERDGRFYKGLLVANHVIVHLPPSHPQRKTGKWKWINDSDCCIDEVECDQCGDLEIYKSNYCPNCGARMDGESE